MPKIVLDAMGSDKHPEPELQAVVEAARLFGEEIILTGPEAQLAPKLAALSAKNVRLVDAPEVFEMTDKISPGALKRAKNSMAIGMQMVKAGEADAFVTMGNTGGAMANALVQLGRIRGVMRPAVTGIFPVKNGRCAVLDIGANAECKPEYLVQFGIMGSAYAEKVLGVRSPRVGLVSNGEEAGKGNDLVKASHPLLVSSGLNFIGNVEGKDLFGGAADVVVTDGFTGNVLLKSSEAVARLLVDTLREELMSNLVTKIGAALARPAFEKIRKLLDPAEIGAAPLLGVDGLVFIGHGRSDARAVVSAIRTARQAVEAGLMVHLRTAIEKQAQSQKLEENA
ncbi:MAG TPA: phosphate acyltransferase PlsX [Anaerolineales bacterium]|nr:phosphate acyltransferase PlsX [Anaerolineales bacterium]